MDRLTLALIALAFIGLATLVAVIWRIVHNARDRDAPRSGWEDDAVAGCERPARLPAYERTPTNLITNEGE